MEPEAKYTVVGGAVLILAVLLAAAFYWLRASGQGADAHRYTINFERQSLEGLEPRSYVTMRGVRVGSVTRFRFSSSKPGVVEVFIAVEPTTPVLESTRATIDRHLVTGLATVRLENLSELSPPLRKTPDLDDAPVIAEGESTIEQVSSTLAQLAKRVDDTMQRLNTVLSQDNINALAATLDSTRRLSKNAEGTLAKADAAIVSLGAAADEVRKLASAVTGDVRTLTARYDTLGADASVSVRELGEAAKRMSASAEQLSKRADALLATGDEELRTTAQALRTAADSISAAAGRLRDPRQVIYGPSEGALGPGEASR
jgi:phospholipid/cholesterol/gamma-HCH transport system substrate-binding protein